MVVDTAPLRCPAVDRRIEEAFALGFPGPPPSTVDETGRSGLDDAALREWIDRAEKVVATKSAAERALLEAYKQCRDASVNVASADGRRT